MFVCIDRGTCTGSDSGRVELGDTSVDGDGAFSIAVDRGQVRSFLVLLEAEIAGGVSYRSLIADARSESPASVVIDPISEAAVRLLEDRGLERFDLAAVTELNAEVRRANASSDFSGQSPNEAAKSATAIAAADTGVQAALDVPSLPPVRSENDGCGVDAGAHGSPIEALLIGVAIFCLGRRRSWRRGYRGD